MDFFKRLFTPAPAPKIKIFKYLDKVTVIDGFYRGMKWVVVQDCTHLCSYRGIVVKYLIKNKDGCFEISSNNLQPDVQS